MKVGLNLKVRDRKRRGDLERDGKRRIDERERERGWSKGTREKSKREMVEREIARCK